MRGLLGFIEDYAIAIKGSIALRTRRIKQQMRIVLAAGALLAALLLATTYLVNLEGNETASDAAPSRPLAGDAPTSTVDDAVDPPETSTTDGGVSDVSAAVEAIDSEDDDAALPDEPAGDEQVASGPTPEGSSPHGLPGGDIQSGSATSSVGGSAPSAPSAPAPSATATTTPPNTPPAPPTTGQSTTTTAPPASEVPPQDAEGGLLGNLTRGVLDAVTGLL